MAQTLPPAIVPPDVLGPDVPRPTPLPDQLPTPVPAPQLTPPSMPPPRLEPGQAAEVEVRQVRVLGNTVFSEAEIDAVVQPFIGRSLTFEELLGIRTVITELYLDRGYVTSGAFLPPQDVSDGVITVQVVEGTLEAIEITGLRRLHADYVRSRLGVAASPPLSLPALETALQLLQIDPLIQRVQAELTAGSRPGQSVLLLTLEEAPAWISAVGFDNYNSPSVGSSGGYLVLGHQNLLGFGDRLLLEAKLTQGIDLYSVSYGVPLTAQGGTLSLSYSHNRSQVVESIFASFAPGINSQGDNFNVTFRQPLWRSPSEEFALGLGLDVQRSQTFILNDIPFSFSIGPEQGRSAVTVLRFSQDWINRTPQRVLAARSQFSLGIGALGATVNDSGTDGRFFSWLGQFQWVQGWGVNTISVFRVAGQLTGDSLLPIEQFGIGGVDTVRGYRQNQRIGDNGIIGSFEVRLPVLRNSSGKSVMQLVPFWDAGLVWNNRFEIPAPRFLSSVGLGLRWQFAPSSEARIDWGIPLNDVGNTGNTWQDSGVSVSVRLNLF